MPTAATPTFGATTTHSRRAARVCAVAALAGTIALFGCTKVDPRSGSFLCSQADPSCPSGQACQIGANDTDGFCMQTCQAATDCDDGASCGAVLPGGEKVCRLSCDVVDGSGCPHDLACLLGGNGADVYPVCSVAGATAFGGACTTNSNCVAGGVCAQPQGFDHFICEQICDVRSPSCGAGAVCRGFNPSAVVNDIEVGGCVPGTGTGAQEGGACNTDGSVECGAGLVCLETTGASPGPGVCSRTCMQNADCAAGPGSQCVYSAGTQSACSIDCDPLTSARCDASTPSCLVFTTNGGTSYTDCLVGGTKTDGQPCPGGHGDCAPGLECVNFGGGAVCRALCRVGQNDCGAGVTCGAFGTPAVIGGVEYGACMGAGGSTKREGQACTVGTSGVCAQGLECVGLTSGDAGAAGLCLRTCTADANCSGGPGSSCVIGDPATHCSLSCDPLTNAGCDASTPNCQAVRLGSGTSITHCLAAGAGGRGDDCTVQDDCGTGLTCVNFGQGAKCHPRCRVGKSDCSGGEVCKSFNMGVLIDGVEYGACDES